MLVHLLLAASSLQQGRADRPSPFASAKLPTAGVFGHERNGPLRESPILFTSDIPNNEMELSQRSSPINWDQIHISIAWICIGLYCFVWFICSIGYTEMYVILKSRLTIAHSGTGEEDTPNRCLQLLRHIQKKISLSLASSVR